MALIELEMDQAVWIGGVFSLLAFVVSLYLIYKHLKNYTQPHLQRYIVRILLMVPIYSVDSWLSLRFPKHSLYFDLFRDCYEAYVIWQFFALLIAFINTFEEEEEEERRLVAAEVSRTSKRERAERRRRGEMKKMEEAAGPEDGGKNLEARKKRRRRQRKNRSEVERLRQRGLAPSSLSVPATEAPGRGKGRGTGGVRADAAAKLGVGGASASAVSPYAGEERVVRILEVKPEMSHPWPCCCLPRFKPGAAFLRQCKRCILQFVFVKPTLALLAAILNYFGYYGDGEFHLTSAYLYIVIIDNISITVSMYYLVLFYHVMKEKLKPFNPVSKFLCIKAVIMFAFWQGVAIAFMAAMGWIGAHEDALEKGWTDHSITVGLENFIICIEMFFVAIAHGYAFGYKTFREKDRIWTDYIPCFFWVEWCCCFCCCCTELCSNFGHVVSQKDVIQESVDVFSPQTFINKIKAKESEAEEDYDVDIEAYPEDDYEDAYDDDSEEWTSEDEEEGEEDEGAEGEDGMKMTTLQGASST